MGKFEIKKITTFIADYQTSDQKQTDMIHSILDTDLYKFTTSYAYIKLFPYAKGTFSFTDRTSWSN